VHGVPEKSEIHHENLFPGGKGHGLSFGQVRENGQPRNAVLDEKGKSNKID
jgi:hypothetical protein